jgi:hypothetical protein
LKLQKEGLCDDDDGVLEKQKKELLQELKGSELINNFAKLYGVQKRLLSSGTIWDELGTTAGIMTNDSNHGMIHKFSNTLRFSRMLHLKNVMGRGLKAAPKT